MASIPSSDADFSYFTHFLDKRVPQIYALNINPPALMVAFTSSMAPAHHYVGTVIVDGKSGEIRVLIFFLFAPQPEQTSGSRFLIHASTRLGSSLRQY